MPTILHTKGLRLSWRARYYWDVMEDAGGMVMGWTDDGMGW
jgi:hypothetical protein